MKRTLSLVLMLALAVPALPLSAATPRAQDDHGSWSLVLALRSGSPIVVTVSGEFPRAERHFISATDEAMTVLDTASSRDGARFLMDVAKRYPAYLTESAGEFVEDDFRLTPAGLFYRGTKIATRSDFVRKIPKAVAVAGAIGAAVAIDVLVLPYFFIECRGCTPRFVLMSIGLPAASGILTALGGRRKAETVYRA